MSRPCLGLFTLNLAKLILNIIINNWFIGTITLLHSQTRPTTLASSSESSASEHTARTLRLAAPSTGVANHCHHCLW
ncbi:MAG: hypothetical protein ACK56F_27515, partial [bacterium]